MIKTTLEKIKDALDQIGRMVYEPGMTYDKFFFKLVERSAFIEPRIVARRYAKELYDKLKNETENTNCQH